MVASISKFLIILIMLTILSLPLTGCSYTYPGLPNLPVKDWLNPESDKTASSAEKLDIYSPDKVMTFEDLVWLAVQESPALSRGLIDLEIREISKRDEKWRFLPEMHLYYMISNNITRYNEAEAAKNNYYDNYGETAYQLSFGGHFRNPVSTYLSVKAQDELVNVAVVTQRKAIARTIYDIAANLLRQNLLEETIAMLETQLQNAKEKQEFAQIKDARAFNVHANALGSAYGVNDLNLRIRENKIALVNTRNALKRMVGLNLKQALKVNTKSVYPILKEFHPQRLDWKNCWEHSEDRYLIHQQVRLEQANILVSWAQYTPNINISVNESAPNGQSQPSEWKTDEFLHLTIDFPLLDWGHRWRMAEMAGARKRQAMLDEIQRERNYEQNWETWENDMLLADARVDRWKNSVSDTAKLMEAAEISFNNGTMDMWVLTDFRHRELDAKIALLAAENQKANAKLVWMFNSNELGNHFLGPIPQQ